MVQPILKKAPYWGGRQVIDLLPFSNCISQCKDCKLPVLSNFAMCAVYDAHTQRRSRNQWAAARAAARWVIVEQRLN